MSSPAADRLIRHRLPDRVFHWVAAAAVLALLVTGFLPILGVRFGWVTIHWIAGVVLTVALVFHIPRAIFWLDPRSMGFGSRDLRDGWSIFRRTVGGAGTGPGKTGPGKPGKYSIAQKLFHHGATVVVLALVVTGLPMMVKIDTPFWPRDPYWLSSHTWGIVYVVHGYAAMATITLLIAHVYFALRPEKLWYTRSMILGWVTRADYLAYHDPARWAPEQSESPRPTDRAMVEDRTA